MPGLVIQSDDFTRVATNIEGGTPSWKNYSPGTWDINGIRAKPTNVALLAEHRALINSYDPQLVLPTSTSTAEPWRYSIEARIKFPAAFPTGSQFMEVGVIANAPCATPFTSVAGWEAIWSIQGNGSQFIVIRQRTGVLGAPVLTTLYTVTLPSPLLAVVGTERSIRLRVVALPSVVTPSSWVIYPNLVLDENIEVGGTWYYVNPNFFTDPKFAGIFSMQNGPLNNGLVDPANMPEFLYVRVRDERNLALAPFFPEPSITPEVLPTGVTLATENDGSSAVLPFQPEYSIEMPDRFETLDMRSDGGFLWTRARSARPRRRWSLVSPALEASDAATVATFLDTLKVTKTTFLWTNAETDEVIRSLIIGPEISRVEVGPQIYVFRWECEEAFGDI